MPHHLRSRGISTVIQANPLPQFTAIVRITYEENGITMGNIIGIKLDTNSGADPGGLPRRQDLLKARAYCVCRRKAVSNALTACGCSCCTQCPAPSTRWQPSNRVQAAFCIFSKSPGFW